METRDFLSQLRTIDETSFIGDVRAAVEYQIAVNRFYRTVCQMQGWSVEQWNGDLSNIPAITVGTFKSSVKVSRWLANVPTQDLVCWMVSSETTGEVSLVGRTARDVEFMQETYAYQTLYGLRAAAVQNIYGFNPTVEFLRLVSMRSVGPELEGRPVLSMSVFVTEAVEKTFALECLLAPRGDGRIGYDQDYLERTLRQAEETKRPIALGGSPKLLYQQLVAWQASGVRFDLPNAWIITGQGGWSGRKARMVEGGDVDKLTYIRLIEDVLRASVINVRDMYGLTEVPSLCEGRWNWNVNDFVFQPPAWMRIYVIGMDLRPVAPGEVGLLKVVVPYGIEGYPGLAILTDDLVQKVSDQAFVYQKRSEGEWNELCGPMSHVIAALEASDS